MWRAGVREREQYVRKHLTFMVIYGGLFHLSHKMDGENRIILNVGGVRYVWWMVVYFYRVSIFLAFFLQSSDFSAFFQSSSTSWPDWWEFSWFPRIMRTILPFSSFKFLDMLLTFSLSPSFPRHLFLLTPSIQHHYIQNSPYFHLIQGIFSFIRFSLIHSFTSSLSRWYSER